MPKRLPHDVLLWCGKKYESHFSVFWGRKFQKLYRGPLKWIIAEKLAAIDREGVAVVARHSVVDSSASGSPFNPFFSDADFTLVISGVLTLARSDRLLNAYNDLRRLFPMIGEVEMFSDGEWALRENLWAEFGELLQFLRDLKKMRWMEWKLESPLHPYHVYKVENAIRRLVLKYEEIPHDVAVSRKNNHRFLAQGFVLRLKQLVPFDECQPALAGIGDLPDTLFSRELDAYIGRVGPAADSPLLKLDLTSSLILLGLCPSYGDEQPSVQEALIRLRKIAPLKKLHVAVLKNELLYACAAPRVHLQYRATSWQWVENLKLQLQNLVSEREFDATVTSLRNHRHEVAPEAFSQTS